MNIDQIARGYVMVAESAESFLSALPADKAEQHRKRMLTDWNDKIVVAAMSEGLSREQAEDICTAIVERAHILIDAKTMLAGAKPVGTG